GAGAAEGACARGPDGEGAVLAPGASPPLLALKPCGFMSPRKSASAASRPTVRLPAITALRRWRANPVGRMSSSSSASAASKVPESRGWGRARRPDERTSSSSTARATCWPGAACGRPAAGLPKRRLGDAAAAGRGRLGGARPVGLLDPLEEGTQLLHVAEPPPAAPSLAHLIAAGHAALDDPLLQRREIAEAVGLAVLRGQRPVRRARRREVEGRVGRPHSDGRRPGARHHEGVPARRALDGGAGVRDAVVVELVFRLA